MADTVRTFAYVIVLIRKQWEAEKGRLIVLAAFAGSSGAAAVRNALDHKWADAVAGLVLCVIFAALWEWRWSVAMRVPGSDKEND